LAGGNRLNGADNAGTFGNANFTNQTPTKGRADSRRDLPAAPVSLFRHGRLPLTTPSVAKLSLSCTFDCRPTRFEAFFLGGPRGRV